MYRDVRNQRGIRVNNNKNVKLLEKVIAENDLIIVNGSDLCKGIITCFRKKINSVEKSVNDYFLVCRRMFNLINIMLIDEDRIYALAKYCNKKGDKNIKESDHNTIVLNIKTNWKTSIEDKGERIEIYNYKKKDDFEHFKQETEQNEDLKQCYKDKSDKMALYSK